jgi:hypothetical protein
MALSNSLLERLSRILQPLGLALLVIGFAGPWIYGPLGKSGDFGWQPIWGFLLSLIPVNLFALASLIICFSYLELTLRQQQPVLLGLLRWLGFFVLLLLLPLLWFIWDQTGRGPNSVYNKDSFGWGVWVALLGWLFTVVALRLKIYLLKHSRKVEQQNP